MLPETRVFRWQTATLEILARSLRYRLMQTPATGIYGDEDGLRSLWDEYCFECHFGPTSQLEYAWDDALCGPCAEVIEKLPQHVAELLSWSLADEENQRVVEGHFVDDQYISEAIIVAAKELAGARDMDKLAERAARPWSNSGVMKSNSHSPSELPLFGHLAAPEWLVIVDRKDLIDALKIARTGVTLKRSGNDWERGITITGDKHALSIRSSNAAYDLPSTGKWDSPIITPGAAFRKLAPKLSGDRISIGYKDGFLRIGTTQYPAKEV